MRRRAEFYYQQLDALTSLRREVRRDLLAESKKYKVWKRLGIEVHSSADHEVVKGQLRRKKKHVEIRGLNENCNHDLKNLFNRAAVVASTKSGPFEEFYAALLAG